MKVGDLVYFVGAKGSGIIVGFMPDGRVSVEEEGMEIPYLEKDLIVIDSLAIAAKNAMVASFGKSEKKSSNVKRSSKLREAKEIDLHVEKIPSEYRAMRSYNILDCQVNYFMDELSRIEGKKGERIVFIHGKGSGKLRSELERELNRRSSKFTYKPANHIKYDYRSALEVITL